MKRSTRTKLITILHITTILSVFGFVVSFLSGAFFFQERLIKFSFLALNFFWTSLLSFCLARRLELQSEREEHKKFMSITENHQTALNEIKQQLEEKQMLSEATDKKGS